MNSIKVRQLWCILFVLSFVFLCCKKEPTAPEQPQSPDSTKPVVKILSPQNNAVILDSTLIQVSATDDKGVVKVEIYIDNRLDSTRVFLLPPYNSKWHVYSLPDSSAHTIYAKAYDGDNNVTSTPVIPVVTRSSNAAPSNLVVSTIAEQAVVLQWRDNSQFEERFEIEMSNDGTNFSLAKTVGRDTAAATVNVTYTIGTNYYFRVRAVSGGNFSRYSNRVRLYYANSNVLYVAGNFSSAGGVSANNIATWDGSRWSSVGSGISNSRGSDYVWIPAMTVYNNELYLGGSFDTVNGIAVQALVRFNGLRWADVGGGLTSTTSYPPGVNALSVYDNELYVTGHFSSAGGTNANGLAKWNGATWSSFGNLGSNDYVLAFTVYNNELYVGGNFSNIGGVTARNVAKWYGTIWSPIGNGTRGTQSLAFYDNKLYTSANSSADTTLTVWDGTSWSNWCSAVGNGYWAWVGHFTVFNNELYVGGQYDIICSAYMSTLARWNRIAWRNVGGNFGGLVSRTYIGALFVYNNELYVGGEFSSAGGLNASNIAKWNGTSWSALGSGVSGGNYPSVRAIASYIKGWSWESSP